MIIKIEREFLSQLIAIRIYHNDYHIMINSVYGTLANIPGHWSWDVEYVGGILW